MNKRVYHKSKSLPCTDVSGTANIFQLLISSRGAEVTTIFWSLPQISVQDSLSIMTPPARTSPAAHQQHMWWKGKQCVVQVVGLVITHHFVIFYVVHAMFSHVVHVWKSSSYMLFSALCSTCVRNRGSRVQHVNMSVSVFCVFVWWLMRS